MVASTHDRNSAGQTYDEWLAQQELPEGFRRWHGSFEHWRQGNPIGWAIDAYKSSRQWHHLLWEESKRERNRKKKNRTTSAT